MLLAAMLMAMTRSAVAQDPFAIPPLPEGQTIPDGSLVKGAPGKVVRTLTDREIEGMRLSAARYVENFKRFQRDLRRQD